MIQNARIRRLNAEYKRLIELTNRSNMIWIAVNERHSTLPPEKYTITYHCRSIIKIDDQKLPIFGDVHQAYIELDLTFPSSAPKMKMLTPIWHPNILHKDPYTICMDPAYWAPGRTLDTVVRMLGEMIQYKIYHAEDLPPWPIDREVANWVKWAESQNILSKSKPIDANELLKPEVTVPRTRSDSSSQYSKSRIKLRIID